MSGGALKPFAIFADLGDAEREDLAALIEERDVSKGETLFEEGDEADAVVLVASGRIELSTKRRRETLALGAGGTIGVLALFAVGAREVSATGMEESAVLLLRREEFLRFAEDHPRAAFRIAAAAVAESAMHARAALAIVDPTGLRE
jgi:CRP-like cAMP-binding protein